MYVLCVCMCIYIYIYTGIFAYSCKNKHTHIKYVNSPFYINSTNERDIVHACNPSTWMAEEGTSQIQGQPGIHSEILSQ
jgi:hypothetical protein